MKFSLIFTFIFLFLGCNSQLAELSPINRTPLKLETKNAETFATMMIWGTNGSHSFARSYTTVPVLDEEVPKGNYEFYAVTLNLAQQLQRCARVSQRLQGKMNAVTLDFQETNCADPAFLGSDPSLDITGPLAVNVAPTSIEFCEDIGSVNHFDDKCTDDLAAANRKSGRGHAYSYRVSMMNFEKHVTNAPSVAFSHGCTTVVPSQPLRGDDTATFSNAFLPGDGTAPFFLRFEFYPLSFNCSGTPIVLDLHRGLTTDHGNSKLVVTPGSPGRKKIGIKLAGPEICQGNYLTEDFAGGDGTISRPSLICNAQQLRHIFPALLTDYTLLAKNHYKLLADIDLSGEPRKGDGDFDYPWRDCVGAGSNFMPIGTTWNGSSCSIDPIPNTFSFDGGGHEIKGLKIIDPFSGRGGLYSTVINATGGAEIRRLKIRGARIQGASNVGAFVGVGETLRLRELEIRDSTVQGSGSGVGGFVGTAQRFEMGFLRSENLIVSGVSNIGGVAGDSRDTDYVRIYIDGTITASGSSAGGIVGQITATSLNTIHKSRFLGSVSGVQKIGGIVGDASMLRILNSYARASLQASHGSECFMGGLAGRLLIHTTGSGGVRAGVARSYSLPVLSNPNCTVLCKTGPIAGHHDGTYNVSDFNTSVFPTGVPEDLSILPHGVPQPSASFSSAFPMWERPVGINLMPFFDPSTWLFQNGFRPLLVEEVH